MWLFQLFLEIFISTPLNWTIHWNNAIYDFHSSDNVSFYLSTCAPILIMQNRINTLESKKTNGDVSFSSHKSMFPTLPQQIREKVKVYNVFYYLLCNEVQENID